MNRLQQSGSFLKPKQENTDAFNIRIFITVQSIITNDLVVSQERSVAGSNPYILTRQLIKRWIATDFVLAMTG